MIVLLILWCYSVTLVTNMDMFMDKVFLMFSVSEHEEEGAVRKDEC